MVIKMETVRYFNTEGSCKPEEHYMVRLDGRLEWIKEMLVDRKKYFVINRGRQYGKTTTLRALEEYLKDDYTVLSLDFKEMATEKFVNETAYSHAFAQKLSNAFRYVEAEDKEALRKILLDFKKDNPDGGLDELFECLSSMCGNSLCPIVLMIDEVDSAGNNQVFIDFLAQLRAYYLKQEKTPVFHSVVLAGVYNIKDLKLKLRPGAEHQYNSPWNIAVKFKMDMSFSSAEIAEMLQEYEADYHTGMDIQAVAEEIYAYTSGYPVLVSSICKCIDEELTDESRAAGAAQAWSKGGGEKAVSVILKENQPLFESMAKQLDTYTDLYSIIEDILYRGKRIPFSPEEKSINLGVMCGFLKEENDHVAVANRIFEMCLLNLFMAKEAITSDVFSKGGSDRTRFIRGNRLDMGLMHDRRGGASEGCFLKVERRKGT